MRAPSDAGLRVLAPSRHANARCLAAACFIYLQVLISVDELQELRSQRVGATRDAFDNCAAAAKFRELYLAAAAGHKP